jgi:hypothetical protein
MKTRVSAAPSCSGIIVSNLKCFLDVDIPGTLCCDRCNPELLKPHASEFAATAPRKKAAKKGTLSYDRLAQIHSWRHAMKTRYYTKQSLTANAILDNDSCIALASFASRPSKAEVEVVMDGWGFTDKLGGELFTFVESCYAPTSAVVHSAVPEHLFSLSLAHKASTSSVTQ